MKTGDTGQIHDKSARKSGGRAASPVPVAEPNSSASLPGTCWCAEETARLPMPAEGRDCLCRECLRKMANAASPSSAT